MNCTFEEAKANYPKGTKFIVITQVLLFSMHPTEKRSLRDGDILELETISRSGNNWSLHYKLDPVTYDPYFITSDNIHCQYIEPASSDNATIKVCECNIFIGPCVCGVFKAEMDRKRSLEEE